ncbi:zf-HC2 domain-containing protein [Sphingobium nicotianae]|uniref:Zf-HC2 domain-containing protein n=1 Tax=Sphingobium nicotianae TaxID=2782607 RepID=A0A9X1IRK4_9SPHN|nr:zf-HC2 domain-containing protein [Sphingobium nicotianae]MBT2187452.1 zf-HC2 domain-containing protein [Sphingobium nicotianae]
MTIDPEMIAAYADGELGPDEAARVEAAMAADPAIAQQVEAHLALRSRLGAHFAPILDMPVPDRLTAMLKPVDAPAATIVDLAAARQARADRAAPQPRLRWMMGGALAASLALGLVLGTQIPRGGSIVTQGGRLVASGALDKALTTQLASAQDGRDVSILLTFKAKDGRFCRGFEQAGAAGIACHNGTGWGIERMQASDFRPGSSGGYRQAGSASKEIMEAAQNMALDGALDVDSERVARDKNWGD